MFQFERDKIEFEFQCMFLTARFSILYNICRVKLNKNMQIKHVKDRKKNLAFSVYLFFSIEIDTVLAKLLTLMNNIKYFTQRTQWCFIRSSSSSMPSYRG